METKELEKRLDLKCERRVITDRFHRVVSDNCANCDGYQFDCEHYFPIKKTQIPIRRGMFAQRGYFKK